MSQKLSYISDEVLYREVQRVLLIASEAVKNVEKNFYRNKVDPFSAVFDSLRQGVNMEEWKEQEKARKIQKTMQNALGDFHQAILGSMSGWKDLGVGSIADVRNDSKKLIAEVKNKYNTTKGNHKKVIYDDLLGLLNSTCKGYTSYYVEVIPSSKKGYDKPFTPSDNETHIRRPVNEKIRVIDGKAFYALASGQADALKQLYEVLPQVIADLMGKGEQPIDADPIFAELYERIFPKT